jgi:2-isopropylmalate synthase
LEEFHTDGSSGQVRCQATVLRNLERVNLVGCGNGPIAAFVNALKAANAPNFEVGYYREHALSSGADARAIAYVQIKPDAGAAKWGAGVDTNIELASIQAVLSALNRLMGN